MGNANDTSPRLDWRLGEQHFTGTRDEVAAQLDHLILMLVAYRQTLPVAMSLLPLAITTRDGADAEPRPGRSIAPRQAQRAGR
jgi:hypothetical protein